ncbi:hypothetical protein ACJJTC_005678, partial [Scirpophaga incertulas]
YEDLIETHNTTLEKLQIVQEENSRLKTQCHELTQERNAVIRERNALKQQVASVVRQWDGGTGARERADIKRLTSERNAALAEYTLIMSERDTVHKEMEKLSDDLQAALKRVAALEAALQASRKEQMATAVQAESLRLEIESALVDRDRAIKECSDLKTPQNAALAKSRQDNSAYHHLGLASGVGNDGFLNGQHSNDPSLDKLQGLAAESGDKERAEGLDHTSPSVQRLRTQIERLQAELCDATREAEVSKRRRDWAFAERDKLLQERESVKALCNKLRKERDQMVGELAEARRHGGKKEGKDKGRELEDRRHSYNHDHDHDHDRDRDQDLELDLEECSWESLSVELPCVGADGELGFEVGGRAHAAPRVLRVRPGSVADGLLRSVPCSTRWSRRSARGRACRWSCRAWARTGSWASRWAAAPTPRRESSGCARDPWPTACSGQYLAVRGGPAGVLVGEPVGGAAVRGRGRGAGLRGGRPRPRRAASPPGAPGIRGRRPAQVSTSQYAVVPQECSWESLSVELPCVGADGELGFEVGGRAHAAPRVLRVRPGSVADGLLRSVPRSTRWSRRSARGRACRWSCRAWARTGSWASRWAAAPTPRRESSGCARDPWPTACSGQYLRSTRWSRRSARGRACRWSCRAWARTGSWASRWAAAPTPRRESSGCARDPWPTACSGQYLAVRGGPAGVLVGEPVGGAAVRGRGRGAGLRGGRPRPRRAASPPGAPGIRGRRPAQVSTSQYAVVPQECSWESLSVELPCVGADGELGFEVGGRAHAAPRVLRVRPGSVADGLLRSVPAVRGGPAGVLVGEPVGGAAVRGRGRGAGLRGGRPRPRRAASPPGAPGIRGRRPAQVSTSQYAVVPQECSWESLSVELPCVGADGELGFEVGGRAHAAPRVLRVRPGSVADGLLRSVPRSTRLVPQECSWESLSVELPCVGADGELGFEVGGRAHAAPRVLRVRPGSVADGLLRSVPRSTRWSRRSARGRACRWSCRAWARTGSWASRWAAAPTPRRESSGCARDPWPTACSGQYLQYAVVPQECSWESLSVELPCVGADGELGFEVGGRAHAAPRVLRVRPGSVADGLLRSVPAVRGGPAGVLVGEPVGGAAVRGRGRGAGLRGGRPRPRRAASPPGAPGIRGRRPAQVSTSQYAVVPQECSWESLSVELPCVGADGELGFEVGGRAHAAPRVLRVRPGSVADGLLRSVPAVRGGPAGVLVGEPVGGAAVRGRGRGAGLRGGRPRPRRAASPPGAPGIRGRRPAQVSTCSTRWSRRSARGRACRWSCRAWARTGSWASRWAAAPTPRRESSGCARDPWPTACSGQYLQYAVVPQECSWESLSVELPCVGADGELGFEVGGRAHAAPRVLRVRPGSVADGLLRSVPQYAVVPQECSWESLSVELPCVGADGELASRWAAAPTPRRESSGCARDPWPTACSGQYLQYAVVPQECSWESLSVELPCVGADGELGFEVGGRAHAAPRVLRVRPGSVADGLLRSVPAVRGGPAGVLVGEPVGGAAVRGRGRGAGLRGQYLQYAVVPQECSWESLSVELPCVGADGELGFEVGGRAHAAPRVLRVRPGSVADGLLRSVPA